MRSCLLALALVLVSADALAAQVCPAGQVKNEDTRGRCCWPNQVWSGRRSACVGIPACPAPLVVEGETCRGAPAPAAPAPQPADPVQPASPPAAPSKPAPQPAVAQPAVPVQPAPQPPGPAQPEPQPVATTPPAPAPSAPVLAAPAAPVSPPPPPVVLQPAPQPVYVPPGAVFVPVSPTPLTRTVYVRQPGKIVTGAFLLALAIGAIGSSVPLWQDALDDKQTQANKHFSGQDGLSMVGAVVLDAAGIAFGAVGGATLGKGLRGRAVEVPLAFRPEPVHGRVAKVEVALAF